ncbi:MAG TPA: prepilin-type N-terminal cleavage/methylation domain-containing protein [Polyangiaceae bacterium]|jgi:type IV fimbrial biogenesis protein FimT|nr:prepilin-type N-terminal cleavage/methylation domain-containing protein [Polyangiaceae bacterium]
MIAQQRPQFLRACRPLAPGRRPLARLRTRAFTLIELMVVVLIITVMAGLAIPTAIVQLRDRRVQEAARTIGSLFREARMQAVGRGAAVLVRYNSGVFTVLEAREGTTSTCPDTPVPDCLGTPWASEPTRSRETQRYQPVAASGDMAELAVTLTDSKASTLSALEVCFSPNGRAFARHAINDGTALLPMSQVYTVTLTRKGQGRSRVLALLPNGTARLQ